jgi:hypothetical protein
MRIRSTDRFAVDARASVLAIGTGVRGGETKYFAWLFRRSYELTDCAAEGGGFATTLELAEGAASELRLEVRGEELFRAFADDGADLLFQPIADADGGDGLVTLDDLSLVPRPPVGGREGAPGTHESLLYEQLLPRLVRVLGAGPCEAEVRDRR